MVLYHQYLVKALFLLQLLCHCRLSFIPDFAVNFLSIARELNCKVIFYSDYCFFQDLVTGRIIGSGSLRDGLYYLDY
jgi:hypothetical protein